MIVLSPTQLHKIEKAAEAAYPAECCGLLVGAVGDDGVTRVSRVVVSRNLVADARKDRFEIDPQVHFDLMRELRGTAEQIVGHYHSHPNHPAEPSTTDAAMLFDMKLIWLITAVGEGKVQNTAAFRPSGDTASGSQTFAPCPLAIDDTTAGP